MAGLWEAPGVPHKGWRCIDVEDLRPDGGGDYVRGTCEMCLNGMLRVVHTMEHDEYPETVEVGCICAESMAEGYDGKAREATLKKRRTRRQGWLKRKWRTSEKGNPYLNIGDYNVGVFQRRYAPGGWIWRINDQFGKTTFPTEQDAKLALFDVLSSRVGWDGQAILNQHG